MQDAGLTLHSKLYTLHSQLNSMEKEFIIKAYGKAELAQIYSPELSPDGAKKRLKRYITLTPGLLAALQSTGYSPTQQMLTPRQVEIIVNAIGEP